MANSYVTLHLRSEREKVGEREGREGREGEREGREGVREGGRHASRFLMANFLSDTLQLCEVCLSLIQAYAKSSVGRYSRLSLEEEEQCMDLLLFMKMMAHLTIKDCLDLGG